MIYRYVFQRSRTMPGKRFLEERLAGAIGYDRIAGYFDTSGFLNNPSFTISRGHWLQNLHCEALSDQLKQSFHEGHKKGFRLLPVQHHEVHHEEHQLNRTFTRFTQFRPYPIQ